MTPKLAPIDRWTIGFVVASLGLHAILKIHHPIAIPVFCGLALVAFAAHKLRTSGRAGIFLGEFYPVLLLFAIYTEVGLSNRVRGISYDHIVQSWEQLVFGSQPAREWMIQCPSPLLSNLLHLGYLSYYLIVLGVPLALWFNARKPAASKTILLMMVTFYVCFTIFRIFPVAGPRYLFPMTEAALQTPIPRFAHELVATGSAWGTAFPSSHVAVAIVNTATAWLGWKPLGVVTAILAASLAAGTVYGGFHYGVDTLAGGLLALLILTVWKVIASPHQR